MKLCRFDSLIICLLCIELVACGKTEPPPPPPPAKIEAPVPSAEQALSRLFGEVYVFAYPLVLMDVTRQVDTAKTPMNAFAHTRARPESVPKGAEEINADVLFSRAWLDLGKEPVVLSFPDTKERYYVAPMLDAWTNVFSSPGKRQSGTDSRDFAVVGPFNKQSIPHNLAVIKSPTDMVWVLARIDPGGDAGYAAATKLQDKFLVTPLSEWGKRRGNPPRLSGSASQVDTKTSPVEQVARMDAKTYFKRVASLLAGNPPSAADAPMVEKMAKLGIVAGKPFDISAQDTTTAAAMDEGARAARDSLAASARSHSGELIKGWTIEWDTGRYGAYYGLRAIMAALQLGANAPEDAIFASTRVDSEGKPLSGANRYVLHFDKGKSPPTEAFWSLSMYDEKKHFVPNSISRHNLGDNDKLRTNDDGSLDLYLQHQSPGKDKESNWLPSPEGPFNVILRIYWPKDEVLARKWTPPPIDLVK